MAGSLHDRTLYLIGPPVHEVREIKNLTASLFHNFLNKNEQIVDIQILEEPVTYRSKYLIAENLSKRPLRPGLRCLHLWKLRVQWQGWTLRYKSFSVKVDDEAFHDRSSQERSTLSPAFEVFFLCSPFHGSVLPENVFELRMPAPESWMCRSRFFPEISSTQEVAAEMKRSTEVLTTDVWSDIWSLESLLPSHPDCSRRKSRGTAAFGPGKLQVVSEKLLLDTMLPEGLWLFLSSCAPRPKTYEIFCRELYMYETSKATNFPQAMPAWLEAKGLLKDTLTPEHLCRWWFTALACESSQSVNDLIQRRADVKASQEMCLPVRGFSSEMLKTLDLKACSIPDHLEAWNSCWQKGIALDYVDLKGKQCAFIKGIKVRSVWLPTSTFEDTEVSPPTTLKTCRLALLEWLVDGKAVKDENGRAVESIHYVSKADYTKKWLLFQDPFVFWYALGSIVTVYVKLGSWCGNSAESFTVFSDTDIAHKLAVRLEPWLCIPNIMEKIISPLEFLSPKQDLLGRFLLLCWGGPGTGKTSQGIVPALLNCIVIGGFALMLNSMNSVRNTHVHMLSTLMPPDVFDRCVLVLGARDLDDLSSTRTLSALVWKEMKTRVEAWEDSFSELRRIILSIDAIHQPLKNGKSFPAAVIALIDSFGGFSVALAEQHRQVAVERCAIEASLSDKRRLVLSRIRVMIATYSKLQTDGRFSLKTIV